MGDIVAWLPYATPEEAAERLGGLPDGVRVDCYRADGDDYPDSVAEAQFYVIPYMRGEEKLSCAAEMSNLRVVQTLTAGYENFLPHVPETATLCNAAGVHDASTAELALALTLASGRHLDTFARQQPEGRWAPVFGSALADKRVLIIGYGRIGEAIERRLAGFEVASITRVARRARDGEPRVHATSELPELIAEADVAIVIAPLTPETEGLIDADLLAPAARRRPAGQRRPRQAGGHRRPGRRDRHRPDPGRAGRHRSRAAAARAPAVADPERADLPARRRGQLGVLAAGRPAGRRPAAPVRRR